MNPSKMLEEARQALQADVDASSLRIVAAAVGINHNTLAQFLDGTVKRPRAAARQRILAYVQNRPTSAGSTTTPPAGGEADTGAGGAPTRGAELRSPLYWAGRQDASFAFMQHVANLLQMAVTMHGQALDAQRDIITHTTPVPREEPRPPAEQPVSQPLELPQTGWLPPPVERKKQA